MLFRKKGSALNIMHQFRQSIYTAPNMLAGLAGFLSFYFLVFKRKLTGSNSTNSKPEGKLADKFARRLVADDTKN
jgi:hypothetical protein